MTHDPAEIETLHTAEVYSNRWMRVREDRIRRADGVDGIYGVVEKPDFSAVAALENGYLYLVEQYRYPVGARHWELPMGTWPAGKTGSAEDLARTELREETGLVAESLEHIGQVHIAPGFCTQRFDLFLATGLQQNASNREPEELGMICRKFSVAEVLEMIRSGILTDAATIACVALLQIHGRI